MPPRQGRSPFRNQERDRRYLEIVSRAAEIHANGQADWGARHVIPIPFPDEATAKRHERIIWAEARYQGLGRKVTVRRLDSGEYEVSFQLWTKAAARQFVAERARQGGGLPYNARRAK